jgi:hypothetical protein
MDHQVYPAGVKSKTHEPKKSHLTFPHILLLLQEKKLRLHDGWVFRHQNPSETKS